MSIIMWRASRTGEQATSSAVATKPKVRQPGGRVHGLDGAKT